MNNETKLGVFLNILISYLIQFIWIKMADISFLTVLSLISVNILGIANTIQSGLFGFVSFDLL